MPASSATSWAEIDLTALHETTLTSCDARRRPPNVAAVVKADAYGHGAVTIARAALQAGAASLCVFTVREAVELRESGIDADMLCMGPVLDDDPAAIAQHGIAAVADSADTLTRLAAAAEISRACSRSNPHQH